jgi:molybdopterin-guanine dinucleotide biosynthesis protein A
MNEKISGVVLAGGANKRFGGHSKSQIVINGETIISRIIGTISSIFSEIILVTNTPEEFSEFSNCVITGDHFRNTGPIGGIHAGMKISARDSIFVIASDMPLIQAEFILREVKYFEENDYDIVTPRIGDLSEPLHSIYRKSLLKDVEDFINAGTSKALWEFFRKSNVGYMDLDDADDIKDIFLNVNSPSDLALVKNILEKRRNKW